MVSPVSRVELIVGVDLENIIPVIVVEVEEVCYLYEFIYSGTSINGVSINGEPL